MVADVIGCGAVRDLPHDQCTPTWDYEFRVPDSQFVASVLLESVPTLGGELKGEIDELLFDEIAERRADPREDILSLLVSARFEDGGAGLLDDVVTEHARASRGRRTAAPASGRRPSSPSSGSRR